MTIIVSGSLAVIGHLFGDSIVMPLCRLAFAALQTYSDCLVVGVNSYWLVILVFIQNTCSVKRELDHLGLFL